MKTILAAKEKIAQLWGYPKPKATRYRLMKYLIRTEYEEGLIFHNVVTGQMILLSNEEMNQLKQLPSVPTALMQELIANHFLVPEDYNEYKSVNQLRAIYQKRYTGNAINHFIILPTTFCNAHCFYCYESDYPRIHMTEDMAEKIIDYIDEHRQGKEVLLSWFGGEPLVGMDRIDQISQGLKDRKIPFSSTMISNGYLFDEKVVHKSCELWNLKRVQITLDGTEKVYNQVKAYVKVKDNPFQRVLRNVDYLSDNGIHVNIRLNVDFYNKEDIRILIDELGERYSGNRHVRVYMNMLFNNQGFEPVHHSQEDIIELSELIDGYAERLNEFKIGVNRLKIPFLQVSQCMADNPHAVMIQPDGSFCRCEHENVSDSYGSVDDGIRDLQKLKTWRETIERSPDCSECSFYPVCYKLSHCMNADDPCSISNRDRLLKKYKNLLKSICDKKNVEDDKDEGI